MAVIRAVLLAAVCFDDVTFVPNANDDLGLNGWPPKGATGVNFADVNEAFVRSTAAGLTLTPCSWRIVAPGVSIGSQESLENGV